jgi:cytidylate kinase
MTSPLIIAIDGPSASGKGTLARKLAEQFDFAYLDTGLLYRAVGLAVRKAGQDPADPAAAEKAAWALDTVNLNDPTLRTDEAGVAASKVAAIPAVRAALLQFQKDFCAQPPGNKRGAVLDGRDIGTIIAPDAKVKIYVTASAEARSQRRFKELQARGENVTYAAVLKDMQERDARDMSRSAAPLKPAPDAVTLDTTEMSAEAAFQKALDIASEQVSVVLATG